MDILEHNRIAWNKNVERKNPWTVPVTSEAVAAARQGRWEIILTPTKPVPREWFPDLEGCDVLCLASGGGQQGPILAAVGANVTVLDNSPNQLAQDRTVAERDGLEIITVEGDMADLSAFSDRSFDLIVHPVSNVFAPDIRPVWREAFRVLRPGGALMAGITNPVQSHVGGSARWTDRRGFPDLRFLRGSLQRRDRRRAVQVSRHVLCHAGGQAVALSTGRRVS